MLWSPGFEVGLVQNLVDHETLFCACHGGLHVGLVIHPLTTKALNFQSKVGRSRHFPRTRGFRFQWSPVLQLKCRMPLKVPLNQRSTL